MRTHIVIIICDQCLLTLFKNLKILNTTHYQVDLLQRRFNDINIIIHLQIFSVYLI
jgi:hypothetical protein